VKNPTASYLHRASECPPSCTLPSCDVTSPDAARGTAGHRFLEAVAQTGGDIDASLAAVPEEHREMCAAIDLDGLPLGPDYMQEAVVRVNIHTGEGEILGRRAGHRQYDHAPQYVYGTADVLHRECVEVWDYKFEGFESHHLPPARNHQLMFLALAAARARRATSATVGLIHIRPNGSHWIESAEMDAFDLDAYETELCSILDRVAEARATVAEGRVPDVRRGPWCRYCPAAAACPAVTGLIRAVALEPVQTAEQVLELLTPETASRAYLRLQEIEAALKPVRAALHLYADEHPIALPDGRVYGPVTTTREEIDARVARKALAAMYGPEVAEAACDFSTSKAAIQRAIRAVVDAKKKAGEKSTQKAVFEEALAAIRAAGGTTQTRKTTVREHKAGKEES
jgi:hypothetical protein